MGASLRLEALAGAIELASAAGRLPDGWQAAAFRREVSVVLGHLGMIGSRSALASSYARESRRVGLSPPRADATPPPDTLPPPAALGHVTPSPPDTLGDPLDVAYALRFMELAPERRRTA
jgi:hypothetical protein